MRLDSIKMHGATVKKKTRLVYEQPIPVALWPKALACSLFSSVIAGSNPA